MISLRQLRYLDALARHRHFGRAAQACAISQPALSMQIRDLEHDLGAALVERRSGDIRLTEIGAEIARRAETILAAVHDIADYARHSSRPLCGPLRLGIIPTLAPYLLPRILPALQSAYPELRLELRETQTALLIAELARGDIDAALIALPIEHPDIESTHLFDDPFLLATPADDPPKRKRVTPRDIDPSRLILLEEGHCLRDQALAVCGAQDSARSKELGATSLATVLQMVASGYGVTLVPEIALSVEMHDARVQLSRFRGPQPRRAIGLAWRRMSGRARDVRALSDLIVRAVSKRVTPKLFRHRDMGWRSRS